jgi:hypothetical protein
MFNTSALNRSRHRIKVNYRIKSSHNYNNSIAPDDEDDDNDEKEVPGAYNPAQYANLPVSSEIKELFEYI